MKILVTGIAGFIGFHLAQRLAERGDEVIGIDNLNDYYDVRLKYARLAELGFAFAGTPGATPTLGAAPPSTATAGTIPSSTRANLSFRRLEIADAEAMRELFAEERPDRVCHLAAQAGVRYSLQNPGSYVQSNVVGFLNILEGCRHNGVGHLVYASTSSVYGLNEQMPFNTAHPVEHPVTIYAATKKSNELFAHTYSHLFGLPTTGLRFFTVYGPWGRPDMALFLFTQRILRNEPIDVYNNGNMKRDFTYVDDIVEGVIRCLDRPAAPDPAWDPKAPSPAASSAPYRVYNIGNGNPAGLMDYIEALESALGRTAVKNYMPMQPGDVPATWADTTDLQRDTGYAPSTPITVGVKRFVDWYLHHYQPVS